MPQALGKWFGAIRENQVHKPEEVSENWDVVFALGLYCTCVKELQLINHVSVNSRLLDAY